MKLPVSCMHPDCFPSQMFYLVEVSDDFVCRFDCEKGHHTAVILQEQRFEILAVIGANAIIDGYYREAVSSFTASLERFYEFYLSVVTIKHGIADDLVTKAWKVISNQSERQLGAFVYTYLMENFKSPTLLSDKMVSFRNNVIHKGKIPNKKEAIEYANAVLEIVNPLLHEMKRTMSEHIREATRQHVFNVYRKIEPEESVTTLAGLSILSVALDVSEPPVTTIEKHLDFLVSLRKL